MTLLRKASVCILLAALLYGAFAGARPARAATPGQVACVILTFGICVAFQDLIARIDFDPDGGRASGLLVHDLFPIVNACR